MAEQRGGEVRDEKDIRFGGGAGRSETIDADEDVGKQDSKRVNNFNKNITDQNEDGDNKAMQFIVADELSGPRDDGNAYVVTDSFYSSGMKENTKVSRENLVMVAVAELEGSQESLPAKMKEKESGSYVGGKHAR
ncbi:hypothetical protein L1887_35795 [Cichorium endivia]|nr:hypothetical protein L1887_35795 [Cichorium endivia]